MSQAGPSFPLAMPAEDRARKRASLSAPRVFRSSLDALIAVYAAALALAVIGIDVDVGPVSLHGAAKPLLVLLLAVPVRLTLGGRSWLADLAGSAAGRIQPVQERLGARMSASTADAAFAAVVVTGVSLAVAFLASHLLQAPPSRAVDPPFSTSAFVTLFAAWDSGWYWDIANRGYYYRDDAQSSIAFFPLYPMLMRAVAPFFGGGEAAVWLAGIAVSCTAFFFALVELHRLTLRLFGDREVARRTVLYVAVFPWSLFMTRIYPESLFLLTSVLAVSRAYEGRWRAAGVWAALATLARPNGILIGLPLGLLALRGLPGLDWRQLAARLGPLALAPAALAGYSAYVYTLTGDPTGWLAAQAHWGYTVWNPPWQQILRLVTDVGALGPAGFVASSPIAPFELLHGSTAILFLMLTPVIVRRLGLAMGAYVLVSLLIPLSSNALEGHGRYASVLFPAFICLGTLTTARLHEAVVIVAIAFHTLAVWLFITWQPIY